MDNSMRGLGSFLTAFGAKFHMPSGGENAKDLIPLLLAQSKSQNQEDVLAGKKSLQAQTASDAMARTRVTTASGMYKDFMAANQDEYDSGDPKRIAAADNKLNGMMTAWAKGTQHVIPTSTPTAVPTPKPNIFSSLFGDGNKTQTGKITPQSTAIVIKAMKDAQANPTAVPTQTNNQPDPYAP
jgi:hypothetical protein